MGSQTKKKPQQYNTEFKIEAVKMVLEKRYKQVDVARDLGINPNVLNRWISQFKADGTNAFPGQGKLNPDEQRIRDLEAQVNFHPRPSGADHFQCKLA